MFMLLWENNKMHENLVIQSERKENSKIDHLFYARAKDNAHWLEAFVKIGMYYGEEISRIVEDKSDTYKGHLG